MPEQSIVPFSNNEILLCKFHSKYNERQNIQAASQAIILICGE